MGMAFLRDNPTPRVDTLPIYVTREVWNCMFNPTATQEVQVTIRKALVARGEQMILDKISALGMPDGRSKIIQAYEELVASDGLRRGASVPADTASDQVWYEYIIIRWLAAQELFLDMRIAEVARAARLARGM